MRDRWAWVSFGSGLALFCAVGLATGHHLPAAGLLVALLAGTVLAALTLRVLRHRRLVAALRARSEPTELAGLRVRWGELGDAAFVAGLRRPTIFCDRGLPGQLTPDQLRAVLLHERAHQRSFDPARLLLVDLVAPVLRRVPAGRRWLAATLAHREIAADRHAIAHGAAPSDLAAALLVLPPLAHPHVAGFTPAVELRLRALLGEVAEVRPPSSVRRAAMLVAGALVGAGVCAWFLHRSLTSAHHLLCC
jgi:beta-lactamase regulating signal transducer with metallopeptidase domain